VKPYFERPGYVEFRLGDYQHELGIIDSKYAPTVVDPFGNILGIMYNPHYLEILTLFKPA
jgi:hypothetical protein